MKFRAAPWMVVLVSLATAGVVLDSLAAPIRLRWSAHQPVFQGESLAGSLGREAMMGLLGGFRTLVADFLWLQVQDDWEKRDVLRTQASLRLATTVDPRPLVFWVNGARMIAYDMPVWRITNLLHDGPVGSGTVARVDAEHAHAALAWLRDAERFHPRTPAILLEEASIRLNRLRDMETAADCYRRAAELAGAPDYAARVGAELLRRLGRKQEAYEWLRRLHPTLPPDSDAASADLVLSRIRILETELSVPAELHYRAR